MSLEASRIEKPFHSLQVNFFIERHDTHVNYTRTTCKLGSLKYDFLLRPTILLTNLLFLRIEAFWGGQLC